MRKFGIRKSNVVPILRAVVINFSLVLLYESNTKYSIVIAFEKKKKSCYGHCWQIYIKADYLTLIIPYSKRCRKMKSGSLSMAVAGMGSLLCHFFHTLARSPNDSWRFVAFVFTIVISSLFATR